MAQFGGVGNYDSSYFDECFGKHGITEKEIYSGGVDDYEYKSNHDNFVKSVNKAHGDSLMTKDALGTNTYETQVTTQYSANSGYMPTMIPIWVSPDVINISRKKTPLLEMLPKEAIRGITYDWITEQFATTNARFLPQDSPLNDYTDTPTRNSKRVKYLYSTGRVTGPMQVASRGFINQERRQVLNHAQALLQKLENEIINGAIASDANGFDGLLTEISTNDVVASAALTLDNVNTMIRYAKQGGTTYNVLLGGGDPNLIVTDLATYDDFEALLRAYRRFVNTSTIAWGIEAITFRGIPVLVSKFMTTTSGSKAMIAIDTNVVRLGVALEMTMERLAKVNDSNKFYLKWYGVLLVLVETHNAKITLLT